MFDWIGFFNEHRIPYTTTGPNVSVGRVAIKCPFCGNDDPSEHLVVNLNGDNWWCWRRRTEHKGRSPEWLIQNLIHCTFDQARVLTGGVAIGEDFLGKVNELLDPPTKHVGIEDRTLVFPKEFKPFTGLPSSRAFVAYMTQSRGFNRDRVNTVFTRRYGLRYCTAGAYQGRIVFPVRYQGKLIGWTGRTISKNDTIRYKALTTDVEKAHDEGIEPALAPINHYLLWYDRLINSNAETIVLVEGPFDALMVEELGRKIGVASTCFFTSSPTEQQVGLFHELLPRFKNRYLIPDKDATHFGLRTAQLLSSLGVVVKMLPDGIKDPGELRSSTMLQEIL